MIKILEKLKDKINLATTPKKQTVYRYVSQEELTYIQNGQTENLGNYFYGKKLANNHNYKPDVKYMHFFKDQNIPNHILGSLTKGEKYVCTFEIDSKLLRKHQGVGTYEPSGYDDYTYIKEYALPVEKYEASMFVGSQKHNPDLVLQQMSGVENCTEENSLSTNLEINTQTSTEESLSLIAQIEFDSNINLTCENLSPEQ